MTFRTTFVRVAGILVLLTVSAIARGQCAGAYMLAAGPAKAVGEVALPGENTLWDPLGFAESNLLADQHLGPYQIRLLPKARVAPENLRAYMKAGDLRKYAEQCMHAAKSASVRQIETAKQKQDFLEVVKLADKRMAFVETGSALIAEPLRTTWPVAAVLFLKEVLDQSEYAESFKKLNTELATLVEVGGRVDYEERLYRADSDDQPWMIYRALVYKVALGKAERWVPLCVATVRVVLE